MPWADTGPGRRMVRRAYDKRAAETALGELGTKRCGKALSLARSYEPTVL